MRKIPLLLLLSFTWSVVATILAGGIWLYAGARRSEWIANEFSTRLPWGGTRVTVQSRGSLGGGRRYELIVETPQGRLVEHLWDDQWPAGDLSLYRTGDDHLVAMGGGIYVLAFAVDETSKPRRLAREEEPRGSGEDWTYLGAFSMGGEGAFSLPAEQRECLNLYGAGELPYRKTRQVDHSTECPR